MHGGEGGVGCFWVGRCGAAGGGGGVEFEEEVDAVVEVDERGEVVASEGLLVVLVGFYTVVGNRGGGPQNR